MQEDHDEHGGSGDRGDAASDVPLDPRPRQTVQPVEPQGEQGQDGVQPVDQVAAEGVLEIDDVFDSDQCKPGGEHGDRDGKQDVADPDRSAVAAIVSVSDV